MNLTNDRLVRQTQCGLEKKISSEGHVRKEFKVQSMTRLKKFSFAISVTCIWVCEMYE